MSAVRGFHGRGRRRFIDKFFRIVLLRRQVESDKTFARRSFLTLFRILAAHERHGWVAKYETAVDSDLTEC